MGQQIDWRQTDKDLWWGLTDMGLSQWAFYPSSVVVFRDDKPPYAVKLACNFLGENFEKVTMNLDKFRMIQNSQGPVIVPKTESLGDTANLYLERDLWDEIVPALMQVLGITA